MNDRHLTTLRPYKTLLPISIRNSLVGHGSTIWRAFSSVGQSNGAVHSIQSDKDECHVTGHQPIKVWRPFFCRKIPRFWRHFRFDQWPHDDEHSTLDMNTPFNFRQKNRYNQTTMLLLWDKSVSDHQQPQNWGALIGRLVCRTKRNVRPLIVIPITDEPISFRSRYK
jgi:hypothetical protein